MKPRAYPVHHIHGRTRLRIHAHRGNRRFFDEVGNRMRRLPGVKRVDTNPATGSVLIEHSGPLAQLMSAALGSDLADLVEVVVNAPPIAHRLRSEVTSVDQSIRRYTGNELDLATLAALGLIAFAGVQLLRGGRATPAVSLAWYAAELMRRWPEPARAQS